MTLLSCYVFISGILIWKEARNKNTYTEKQKKFHLKTRLIFLSICFALCSAVPVLFMAELLLPQGNAHTHWVNTLFFSTWLILTVVSYFFKSEKKIAQFNLLLTGIFATLVPVVNGLATGDWLFKTSVTQVWGTDLTWLIAGLFCLSIWFFTKRKASSQT
jgi:hypothetical protein